MKPITKTVVTVAVLAAVPLSAVYAQDMSDADKRALVENFLKADTNKDGLLYLSEFQLLMKLNAEDKLGKSAIVVRTGAYAKAFERLDTNGDGAISREEFQELANERG